jgi:hypothetical protein
VRTPRDIVRELVLRVNQPASQVEPINAIVRFDVSGEHSGSWVFKLKETRSIAELDNAMQAPVADCTFRLSDVDFVNLFDGRITGQQLFFDGRLDVEGDLTLTLKLPAITRLLRQASAGA